MGVDATRKWPSEGFAREWPEEIRHTRETLALIESKWPKYGIG
jgi:4-hydroxy-3-polyprenylbenzoate decarboxylase